jgi:hypothetical protein
LSLVSCTGIRTTCTGGNSKFFDIVCRFFWVFGDKLEEKRLFFVEFFGLSFFLFFDILNVEKYEEEVEEAEEEEEEEEEEVEVEFLSFFWFFDKGEEDKEEEA